jgi:hypothetical protein
MIKQIYKFRRSDCIKRKYKEIVQFSKNLN